jgi:cytidine deaminase
MTIVKYGELLAAAREATEYSYAPYSGFRVGAAVLTDNGIVLGCNIENATFSATMCAERVAIFSARAQGKGKIVAVAIATPSGVACLPCGTCRQVMWELARDAIVVVEDGKGGYFTESMHTLFPKPFGPEDLGVAASAAGVGRAER